MTDQEKALMAVALAEGVVKRITESVGPIGYATDGKDVLVETMHKILAFCKATDEPPTALEGEAV